MPEEFKRENVKGSEFLKKILKKILKATYLLLIILILQIVLIKYMNSKGVVEFLIKYFSWLASNVNRLRIST